MGPFRSIVALDSMNKSTDHSGLIYKYDFLSHFLDPHDPKKFNKFGTPSFCGVIDSKSYITTFDS